MNSKNPEVSKKGIKETRTFRRLKLFLKRLVGRELWLSPDTKVNTSTYGGWTICPDGLVVGSVVYSLGIGEDAAFDFELARDKGCEVHGFDPTPNSAQWLADQQQPDGFHFHAWAVAGRDGIISIAPRIRKDGSLSADMFTQIDQAGAARHAIEVPAYSLPSIMARLGHRYIDVLKMDVEGAEYDVLSDLLLTSIRPGQLLVEFHHRFPGIAKSSTVDMIRDLRNAGYKIFHIASTGREISFIQTEKAGGSSGG